MKIFCSGIGGIGLSAYAFHMHARGHEVKGSDREASPVTKALEGAGIGVTTTQDGSGVPDDIDLFVYSEAIPDDAPERRKAKENSVRSLSYFAALGELARGETVIAVCGTHGKSSTTAMIARICIENGLDPSVVVGTKMKELGGLNYRIGRNDLWIVEACEYRSSFLHLSPTTVVMTNVDGDHFDTFDSIEAYHDAFRGFLAKLPQKGSVITHGNDPACATLAKESQRKFIDADTEPLIPLKTPGLHMMQNGQLALAAARALGIEENDAIASLKGYSGSWRRIEMKGTTASGAIVIDDYGHHPVEIKATLQGIRSVYPNEKLIVAFQPHTHDRTLKLWKDFTRCFSGIDRLIVVPVYDARPDRERESVDIEKFALEIASKSGIDSCVVARSLDDATEKILHSATRGDVVLTLGAGNVTTIATTLIADH